MARKSLCRRRTSSHGRDHPVDLNTHLCRRKPLPASRFRKLLEQQLSTSSCPTFECGGLSECARSPRWRPLLNPLRAHNVSSHDRHHGVAHVCATRAPNSCARIPLVQSRLLEDHRQWRDHQERSHHRDDAPGIGLEFNEELRASTNTQHDLVRITDQSVAHHAADHSLSLDKLPEHRSHDSGRKAAENGVLSGRSPPPPFGAGP